MGAHDLNSRPWTLILVGFYPVSCLPRPSVFFKMGHNVKFIFLILKSSPLFSFAEITFRCQGSSSLFFSSSVTFLLPLPNFYLWIFFFFFFFCGWKKKSDSIVSQEHLVAQLSFSSPPQTLGFAGLALALRITTTYKSGWSFFSRITYLMLLRVARMFLLMVVLRWEAVGFCWPDLRFITTTTPWAPLTQSCESPDCSRRSWGPSGYCAWYCTSAYSSWSENWSSSEQPSIVDEQMWHWLLSLWWPETEGVPSLILLFFSSSISSQYLVSQFSIYNIFIISLYNKWWFDSMLLHWL